MTLSPFWLVFALLSFMATGWFIGYHMCVRLHPYVMVKVRHYQQRKGLRR